ncbi:MAG: carboxymuconolactone decarboxylase family protein [Gammaproteobacteria bacterium]|jgi:4-carboxymuconolactone decarboxylase
MSRLKELDRAALSRQQEAIYQDILKSRNGRIEGPFKAWLHAPEFADRAQKLGAFCRYDTSLPPRLSELAILVTARWWQADVEWRIHEPIAREAGLSAELIASLQADRRPVFEHDDEAVVYDFARELFDLRRVSAATYKRAVEQFGEVAVVELVGVLGYYALVAMTLNVFEVEAPSSDGAG